MSLDSILVLQLLAVISIVLIVLRLTSTVEKYIASQQNDINVSTLNIEKHVPLVLKRLFDVAKKPGVYDTGLLLVKSFPLGNTQTYRKVVFSTTGNQQDHYIENYEDIKAFLKQALINKEYFWNTDEVVTLTEKLRLDYEHVGGGYLTVLGFTCNGELLYYYVDYMKGRREVEQTVHTLFELVETRTYIQQMLQTKITNFVPLWN